MRMEYRRVLFRFDYDFIYPKLSESDFYQVEKTEYILQCNNVIDNIKNGNLSKMILSRIIFEDSIKTENAPEIFFKLEKKYSQAFVFLVHLPGFITWLGASPELLINYNNNEIITASLAGTKRCEEEWSNKEIVEQRIVTDYIINILKDRSEEGR